MIQPSPPTRAPARFGVLLPTFDALHTGRTPPLAQGARLAERLGFDAGWVGDHLVCNAPVIDSAIALSAAASVTERLSLGFGVMLLGLRGPDQAARQVATLQALSGARLSLGVGVGGEHPEEFAAAGTTVKRRGRRLDENLDALPARLDATRTPRPRIIVGGRGEPALARAARAGDAWMPMWLSPEKIAQRSQRLCELAAEHGRETPLPLVLMVLACVDEDPRAARATAAAHLMGQYRLALEVVERWTLIGPAESVAEQLRAYLDAGVGEVILMPLGGDPLGQYERLAEVRALIPATA